MEDLPSGWTVETSYRKYAGGFVKDTFYTDPVSGYVFRSKKDVLRYLTTGDIRSCAIKPRKKDMTSAIPAPPRIGDFAYDFNNRAGPTIYLVEENLSENPSGSHGTTAILPENSSGTHGPDSNTNLGSHKRKYIDQLSHPTSKTLGVFGSDSKPDGLPSSCDLTERRLEGIMSDPCISFAVRTLTGEIPIQYPTPLVPPNYSLDHFAQHHGQTHVPYQSSGSSMQLHGLDHNSNAGMNYHNNNMDNSASDYYRKIFPDGATNFLTSILDNTVHISDFDESMMLLSNQSNSSSSSTAVAAAAANGCVPGRNEPAADSQHPSSTQGESKNPWHI